jgi:hypothetical protein
MDYRRKDVHRDRQYLYDRVSSFIDKDVPEKVIELRLCTSLARFFYIDQQVRSTCGTCRIDLIAVHKLDFERRFPFGIER